MVYAYKNKYFLFGLSQWTIYARKRANYYKADEKRNEFFNWCKAREIILSQGAGNFARIHLTHPMSRQSNFVTGRRRGKLFICKTWENFATGAKSGKLRDNKARPGKFVIMKNYVIGKQREFSNWWEAQETMQFVPSGKNKAIVLELEEIQLF